MRGRIQAGLLGALAAAIVLCPAAAASAAANGSLTEQGCIAEAAADGCAAGTGLNGLHGVVVSPDGTDVYAVGKWSDSSGTHGQIVEFERDPTTGGISEIGCVSEGGTDGCDTGHGLADAAGLAISPDGSNVYVVSDSSNAVVVFQRDASTGLLTETGCVAEGGADGCTAGTGLAGATGVAVSPDGNNVYTTSETSSAVATFARASGTGALTELGCIAEAAADGCTPGVGLSHAENLVLSPDGTSLYTTATSASAVSTFSRNTTSGALVQLGCIAESGADGCSAGNGLSGADGIAISGDGTNVYVAAETGSDVATFTRASASGALAEQSCVAETAGDTCTATPGLNGAARVAVSPDGSNVYAAGYFGNTLVTFARDSTGALTSQGCLGEAGADGCASATGLKAPAGLAVSPDGHNVYTGALSGNAAGAFLRAEPYPAPPGPAVHAPSSMDALGDSFTQANYSGGSCSSTAACPANSWSTGTTPSVDSQYQRLTALQSGLTGHAVNRAVSGKPMSYLDTEVQAMIPDAPAYVTIMMGLNDVCGGSMTVNTMTPTTTFHDEFYSAMQDLTSHLPGTLVFVSSIFNPYRLWQILHTNATATKAWTSQTVCPAMLANPTSTASADVSRRQTVLQQVISDNQQLQSVCAQFVQCQFDGNAVFNWKFSPYDVDKTDYFHPSLQGQADLAQVTYQNGFDFTQAAVAPFVTTGPASSVTQTSATLNGTVNPEGQSTTYFFQYGTSTVYGQTTTPQSAGSADASQPAAAAITGLSPATTYHYRLVATNATGTTTGPDQTFSTSFAQAPYPSAVMADGPVSYWRFDESSGTAAADQQNANPGSYTGGYTLGVPGAIPGDSAVALNGSSGYVAVPDSTSLHTGDTFSLEAWVKLAKLGVTDGLFWKGSYMTSINSSGHLVLKKPNAGTIATSTTAITDTTHWHYVVVTKSGSSVHLYIDGVDVTGTVTNYTIGSSTSTLEIGAGAGYLNGAIDEAAVYNKALTAAQVQNHYAAAGRPLAATTSASGVTSTGATLNGTINPEGQDTTYYFEYGTTTSYGQTTTTTDAGAGTSNVSAAATVSGLTPNTTYHVQLVATNASGTTFGGDQTFTTPASSGGSPPTATTAAASSVSSSGATLNGTLNPNGQDTTYYFEYGTTTSYGQSTTTTDAGAGSTATSVSATLTGLSPNTTYHYQLVATNASGTTNGGDQTFTTSPTTTSTSYSQTVLASNPVSYWRLGEQSGTTAADQQGAHPGTYTGGYTLGSPGAISGDPDTSVTLDGTTGYVTVPNSSALNFTAGHAWSVEAWVYPTSFVTSDDMSIVNSREPSTIGHAGYDLGLTVSTGKPYIEIGNGSSYKQIAGPNGVPLNGWSYLVATYDGTQVRLYDNGALVAGPITISYSPNTRTALNLGAINNGAGQFLPGRLDEVAVYGTALDATTIQNHYTAGTGGAGGTTTAAAPATTSGAMAADASCSSSGHLPTAAPAGRQAFFAAPRWTPSGLMITGRLAHSLIRWADGSLALWKLRACGPAVRIPAWLLLDRTSGAFTLRARVSRSAKGYVVTLASGRRSGVRRLRSPLLRVRRAR